MYDECSYFRFGITILSWASTHGLSQLKLGVGRYTEKVYEWFNYLCTSVHHRSDLDNVPTHSLITKSHHLQYVKYKQKILPTRQWTGVCDPLLPAPEAYQNNCS